MQKSAAGVILSHGPETVYDMDEVLELTEEEE